MLQIAICDDDRIHLANTKRLTAEILSTHNPKISEFVGANELLFKMEGTGYSPDIALLDIQMPDIDGTTIPIIRARKADAKSAFFSFVSDCVK